MNIGRAWDSLIGIFSPAYALRNEKLRRQNEYLRRGYSGARNTPGTKNYWNGGSWTDPNSDIRQDRDRVSARIRQLVRDMPYLDEAINAAVAFHIGEGFSFKPAVKDENGNLVKENAVIKEHFIRWQETAEINGRDSFQDIQRLICRQMKEVGEAFAVHRVTKRGEYRLQLFEPDCIQTMKSSESIDQGVEFDPETNENIRFWMKSLATVPGKRDAEFSIPASEAVFMYRANRPWQRRGISPLVQVIIMAADLDAYRQGELSAQQLASRWIAFVTSPDETDISASGKTPRTEVLDDGIIEYMPEGKTVQLSSGVTRPVTGLASFTEMFQKIIAGKLIVPYHIVSQNYAGLNYNTLRELRNNLKHVLRPEWTYYTTHLLEPVYRRWMDIECLSGRMTLPGYFDVGGREHWQRAYWMPPGIESVDILRDVKGVISAAQYGMYDPQDWIMSQGEDPDEIIDGIAEFKSKCSAKGIDLDAAGNGADTTVKSPQGENEVNDEEE